MAKFIALPVAQGDAFYAEMDDGFKVLVDGGANRRALPNLFRQYTKSDGVNVLVCTHNDADHANGVIGFLEKRLHADELWLPSTWLDAVLSLPNDPKETISVLSDVLFDSIPKNLGRESRERLSDSPEVDIQIAAWQLVLQRLQARSEREATPPSERRRRKSHENQERRPLILGNVLNGIADSLEDHLSILSLPWWYHAPPWWYRVGPDYILGDYKWVTLVRTVFKDIKRLLKLVKVALDRGIKVRPFRHNPQNPDGGTRYLVPLNSEEVDCTPLQILRSAEAFLLYAALTTVNKESLVFHLRDGHQNHPGVLFTADSDLEGVDISGVVAGSIVTAPHHGSEANQDVYQKFDKPMIWVRSDRYSKKRPCNAYLNAQGQRFCTLCRNSKRPKQAVRLHTRKGRWIRLRSEPCDCK